MNLSWLDDFLTLAAIGNFSRAADERHPMSGLGVRYTAEVTDHYSSVRMS